MTGYKTYIALAIAVAVAMVEGLMGIDIPGVDFSNNYGDILLAAMVAGGFRSAITGKAN